MTGRIDDIFEFGELSRASTEREGTRELENGVTHCSLELISSVFN